MIILTEFYMPGDPERFSEILYCCKKNLELKYISEIYFFANKYDTDKVVSIENYEEYKYKIRVVECNSRPTYRTFFNFAIKNIESEENIIICNSDIHFDESLNKLVDIDLSGKFVMLTRYDNGILFDVPYSQDSWIFKKGMYLQEADFNLGVPGCDNKIGYLALMNGYKIYNPSKEVKSHHIHKDLSRNYKGKVEGPYLLTWPNEDINRACDLRIISHF